MAKVKTAFFCKNCGAESAKWIGKCPSCNEWNTYAEEVVQSGNTPYTIIENTDRKRPTPKPLNEVSDLPLQRYQTTDTEFNRVLGGGIVPGSIVLLGGEPGIGKSTLLLQLVDKIEATSILYIAGEESEQQVKMRAQRLLLKAENFLILAETNTANILENAKRTQPQIMVVDSIQSLHSPLVDSTPGSVSQIKECAGEMQRFAKENNITVFIVGHITKDGQIAGPKLLEHMVDTVLQFEGDAHYNHRILRTLKNRFGSTAELGIYEMLQVGLRPVTNPSEILIIPREETLSGISIGATMEGMRPLLVEVQALVTPSVYGHPQRSATGFDLKRLNMLLAVLEKRCGYKFGAMDVFVNIAGGLSIQDPSIDLAIVAAMVSSLVNIAVDTNICFAGEVGLSGEVRGVNKINQRISEAEKLGFKTMFLSSYGKINQGTSSTINLNKIAKVDDVRMALFT